MFIQVGKCSQRAISRPSGSTEYKGCCDSRPPVSCPPRLRVEQSSPFLLLTPLTHPQRKERKRKEPAGQISFVRFGGVHDRSTTPKFPKADGPQIITRARHVRSAEDLLQDLDEFIPAYNTPSALHAQDKGKKSKRKPLPRRPRHIIPSILLDLRHIPQQIDLLGLQPASLLDEFPADKQNGEDADHGVAEEEGGHVPVAGQEDGVAADEGHDEAARQRVPRRVGLAPALVRERVAREALGLAGAHEVDEGVGHDGEVD